MLPMKIIWSLIHHCVVLFDEFSPNGLRTQRVCHDHVTEDKITQYNFFQAFKSKQFTSIKLSD